MGLLGCFYFELVFNFSGTGNALGDLENFRFLFTSDDRASQGDPPARRGDDLDVLRGHGESLILDESLANVRGHLQIGGGIGLIQGRLGVALPVPLVPGCIVGIFRLIIGENGKGDAEEDN